jgi:DnaJ-class molecular chaperone
MSIIRGNDYEDLYLETNVTIPEFLSKEQKNLLKNLNLWKI